MKLENKSKVYKKLVSDFGKPKTTKGIFHIFQSSENSFVIFDTQQLRVLCQIDSRRKPKLVDYITVLDYTDFSDPKNHDSEDFVEISDTGKIVPKCQFGLYKRIVSGIVEDLWYHTLNTTKN